MFSKQKSGGLFLIVCSLFFLAFGAVGNSFADEIPFSISIDVINDTPLGQNVYLQVSKDSGSGQMHGFDFLIDYDTTVLEFIEAHESYVFDQDTGSFEWEYFAYRSDTTGTPPGLIRAVGLANMSGDGHLPLSVNIPDDTPLFSLVFNVKNDSAILCQWSPVSFYWKDCGDNTIAIDSAGKIVISDGVYNWNEYSGYYDVSDGNYGFPGYKGAPDSCLPIDTSIVRFANFYNGGIEIECIEDPEFYPSDMNCDGIGLTVSDYILYYRYFFEGLSAFGSNVECAINNSDVNYDGTKLQFEDFIYYNRLFGGSAFPYSDIFPHTEIPVTFTCDSNANAVSLDYSGDLAGMFLLFNDIVTPSFLFNTDSLEINIDHAGSHTRILLAPVFGDYGVPFSTNGAFMTYTGDAVLTYAAIADFQDNVFPVSITTGPVSTPFGFNIGIEDSLTVGSSFSIPVIKTHGSEEIKGFDFLIGFDHERLNITGVNSGTIFDIPGTHEWEYFSYSIDETTCDDTFCPASVIRVVGMAETNNGEHHPLTTDVANETVMFTLEGTVLTVPEIDTLISPVSFFWFDCTDNTVAFGENSDQLSISSNVYNYSGYQIADPYFGFPGYFGASDECIITGSNPAVRFTDFYNGGALTHQPLEKELIVSIDSVFAYEGDTAVALNVYITNPLDSIAAFTLFLNLSNPDIAKFGISASDTISYSVENTLVENWDYVSVSSLSGTYNDIKIVAFANSLGNPGENDITPQENGLLIRLLLHINDDIHDLVTDSSVAIIINDNPSHTAFSDPLGELIGFDSIAYNPEIVEFNNGFISILSAPPGDVNNDGFCNVGDAVSIISYVFNGGAPPIPNCIGDTNCDGFCNIGDAVQIINYVFRGGGGPCSGCN
ncbi:MAG: dockerin type I repeat-containing protein [candidate division Zixibacteria bacterium]|nr:dockerin type I repeat-containing protein [candidate division Zixibacteria bacterium]